jgi:uncharacterized integral membrane protein
MLRKNPATVLLSPRQTSHRLPNIYLNVEWVIFIASNSKELLLRMEIYFLTAIELTLGGSSTVHIYTQTVHRTTQLIWEGCGPCPVFASYTLAFVLQLRKKHGKTSVRVAEGCQLARWKQNMIYLSAIGLTPGGSSTVHIYTQTVHITTQLTT